MRNRFFSMTVAGVLAVPLVLAGALRAQDGPPALPSPPAAPMARVDVGPRDSAYRRGQEALDEGRWADAVADFDKSAKANPDGSEAAMYWKAYSLAKLGKKDEALATCDQLKASRPASSWNRECLMMKAQSGVNLETLKELSREQERNERRLTTTTSSYSKSSSTTSYTDGDGKVHTTVRWERKPASEDDIKIVALNSLMRADSAKALPLLREMIFSNKPMELRKQALFVLTQTKSPEAQALLIDVAKSSKDPELQRQAIETMSVFRGKEAGPTLVEIYRTSSDARVKQSALNGLFVARDASGLVQLARGEKDLTMKRAIVEQLALMRDPVATDYMLELLK